MIKFNRFAFCTNNDLGGVDLDLDSIDAHPVFVREKVLKSHMGWRFQHPDRYSHEAKWQELLKHGSIFPVTISIDTLPQK